MDFPYLDWQILDGMAIGGNIFAHQQPFRANIIYNTNCCVQTRPECEHIELGLIFFKRYRMEFCLQDLYKKPIVPNGFQAHPWDDSLLDAHALVKFQSFRNELDANVFPCLGEREGCRRLMRDISFMSWFQPKSTWLITANNSAGRKPIPCGTVQGLKISETNGSIQNIGVEPSYRGLGIGKLLLWLALDGFRRSGLKAVNLEVTARNVEALRLYQNVGFSIVRTVYKTIDVDLPNSA